MTRWFHTLALLLVLLPLAAQMPDWYNAASRKMHYPSEAWYTGYAEGQQQKGEAIEDALSRLKDAARVELASSIRTTVEQNIDNRTESDLRQGTRDFDEQIRETFVNETRITSSIHDIPGLQVEVYRLPSDGAIAAFAYVRKTTLSNQLVKRITHGIAKAKSALEQAETLMADGRKSEARQTVDKGQQQIQDAEDAQSLLIIVDETADEETLQYSATKTLRQQLSTLEAQLRNAVSVYINCKADLFGGQYSALAGQIKGNLSAKGVNFATSSEHADWIVYVNAIAREYKSRTFGNVTAYTADVEATVAIEKNGQRIYEEQLDSERSAHTVSFVEAAREAYAVVTPKICTIIQEQIK